MDKRSVAIEKLIVALDYDSFEEAKRMVDLLGDNVNKYKVGLEIFLNTNGKIIDYLHEVNKKVFLDLKFHDISNTVKMAAGYAIKKNIFMFNIHASNGSETMKEVIHLIKKYKSQTKVIAVTVLTNLNEREVQELFQSDCSLEKLVMNFAKLTEKSGLHGIVCSSKESKKIKEVFGNTLLTVCPGIRPNYSEKNDQKRVLSPSEAIQNKVDYVVIGRPITQQNDPLYVTKKIINEIEAVL